MEAKPIYPYLCKEGSCLDRAEFEFTDVKIITTEQENGLEKQEVERVVLGHACEKHFDSVKKLLKEIHTSAEQRSEEQEEK
tara:strand:- start:247 stop:489 length:243 start_codon:yes stop_codon:yes gene_type:complete